ncbi:IS66 family insertion sequence element accessory protein TnpA [Clostridium sp. WILCCON 0269]|uniref:IS66 family insertion sequence element accessory protein TnpA n=1 Tax=Candidatus Clostridium eludens TaxID=3381663 RepID=A0ABW8SQH9_9CLOT
MEMNSNEETWKELLEKFSFYQRTVTDYCKENNISKSQFYYYRKKFNKEIKTTFHAIKIKPEISQLQKEKNNDGENNSIKIELGRASIYIPWENATLLSVVFKELLKSC